MSEQLIRASEIAEYIYCRRAWWLRRSAGFRPENIEQLDEGSAFHKAHGATAKGASLAQRLAYLLLATAIAVGLIWLTQAI